MAAPGRSLPDPDLGVRVAVRFRDGGDEVDDVEAPIGRLAAPARRGARGTGRGTTGDGRTARRRWRRSRPGAASPAAPTSGRRRPRLDALAREAVGVARVAAGIEGHGAGQVPVVERDRDVTSRRRRRRGTGGACPPRGTSACHGARIVASMPASARTRRVARSTAVSGSHIAAAGGRTAARNRGCPSAPRSAGRERRRAAGSCGGRPGRSRCRRPRGRTPRSPRARSGRLARETAGERGTHVPRDVCGGAELGDRAVALVGDARVPVSERGRRRVRRHVSRERVDPERLVEVGVDDEPASRHRRRPTCRLTRSRPPRRPPGPARR